LQPIDAEEFPPRISADFFSLPAAFLHSFFLSPFIHYAICWDNILHFACSPGFHFLHAHQTVGVHAFTLFVVFIEGGEALGVRQLAAALFLLAISMAAASRRTSRASLGAI